MPGLTASQVQRAGAGAVGQWQPTCLKRVVRCGVAKSDLFALEFAQPLPTACRWKGSICSFAVGGPSKLK